uniref:PPM-type phosphatase domain-containing protein n=1 Tax=Romanomermis culicivorax TaxID=13658 RepID=A0A915JTU0_ROMCU
MPCVLHDACVSGRSDNNRLNLNGLRLSVCSTQGGRRYMEDRIHLHCQRNQSGRVEYIFLGVFDGHGGSYASEYAKNSLRLNIVSNPYFNSMNDESIMKSIRDGFIETHQAMWKNYGLMFPDTNVFLSGNDQDVILD